MIFHENRLLTDNSHEISNFIFVEKLGKISQNLPSAAVMIGTLRVKNWDTCAILSIKIALTKRL